MAAPAGCFDQFTTASHGPRPVSGHAAEVTGVAGPCSSKAPEATGATTTQPIWVRRCLIFRGRVERKRAGQVCGGHGWGAQRCVSETCMAGRTRCSGDKCPGHAGYCIDGGGPRPLLGGLHGSNFLVCGTPHPRRDGGHYCDSQPVSVSKGFQKRRDWATIKPRNCTGWRGSADGVP